MGSLFLLQRIFPTQGPNPGLLQCTRTWFTFWVGKICCRRDRVPTPVFLGFPCGSAGKESACNVGRAGFDPWVGKIPWRRERLPTPVLWPGEFRGLYSPWGSEESNTTGFTPLPHLRGASLMAQLVKNLPECRRPQFNCWVRKIPWRRDRLPTPVFLGFPCGSRPVK